MKKFFWDIFVKSGSIDAFLGFKECEAAARAAEAEATAAAERNGRQ
ncbi:MAG: YqzL family protein [Clostridiales bacterium]|nr:YqzL family protein [Clostridiales bacterium]